MIHGMSEGTIKRLSNSDTTFAAIIKAKTNTNSGMPPLTAYRKAFKNNSLQKKDLKSLKSYLDWKKNQNSLQQQI